MPSNVPAPRLKAVFWPLSKWSADAFSTSWTPLPAKSVRWRVRLLPAVAGRKLVAEAEAHAKDAGCSAVVLLASPSAIAFYKHCGFAGIAGDGSDIEQGLPWVHRQSLNICRCSILVQEQRPPRGGEDPGRCRGEMRPGANAFWSVSRLLRRINDPRAAGLVLCDEDPKRWMRPWHKPHGLERQPLDILWSGWSNVLRHTKASDRPWFVSLASVCVPSGVTAMYHNVFRNQVV